jgi:hypothetical protein
MFTNNPFESISKALLSGAEKFTPDAAQDTAKLMMDNLRTWGDLAQAQAEAVKSSAMQSADEFKGIKEPQAAFEAFQNNAQKLAALTAKHLQEVTELGVEQFTAGVDLLQQRHPAPDTFSPVAKGMKAAASAIESTVLSTLKAGASATEAKPRRK